MAAEAMKAEQRMYVNGAGEYLLRGDGADEEAAFRQFVERVEEIVAAEQRRFVQHRQSAARDADGA